MWLWVTFGWCAVAAGLAAVHHRLRRVADRYPAEVAAFMLRFETELAEAHPEVAFLGLLPDRFACLLRVDGQETVVGLHEIYRHAQAFPDAFSRTVASLLIDVREIGLGRVGDVDFAGAATSLMPQLRSRQWLDQQGCFGDSGLVHTVVNDELVTVYVIDDAASMVFVCRAHLRRWRKSVEDLHHLAMGNLAKRGTPVLSRPTTSPESVPESVTVRTGDGFDAARLLLLEAQEGLLVAVPDRDTLWLGPEEGQNLEQLMRTTEAIAAQAAHPISASVFRVTDGRLAPLPGPSGS